MEIKKKSKTVNRQLEATGPTVQPPEAEEDQFKLAVGTANATNF